MSGTTVSNLANANNLVSLGWIVLNQEQTSNGMHNALFFGGTESGERIASNRLQKGIGPINGLNFITDNQPRMVITKGGYVGIGTERPTQALAVNGTILAKELQLSASKFDWPDYVFEQGYVMKTLPELESFINQNGHLPHFPSRQAIESSQVIDIKDVTVNLLKTIEEMTLTMLQLHQRLNTLENP